MKYLNKFEKFNESSYGGEKVETNILTKTLNFDYKINIDDLNRRYGATIFHPDSPPREEEYITVPIEVEFIKGMGSNQLMAEIPLLNFYTRKKVGSRLRYIFNSKDKESTLLFNYRGDGWKNFFEVIDSQYHKPFEKIKTELDNEAFKNI